MVSGGVGANRALRARLSAAAARRGARVYYPRIEFCTDNAAMIAVAGLARLQAGQHDGLAIGARAQWPLAALAPLPAAAAGCAAAMPTSRTSAAASRRPYLPARPHRRVHHRLHRLGAARQADGGASTSRCRSTAARAARSDEVADTLDYKKVAKRVLAFIDASEFKLVETLAHRLALLILEEFALPWVRVSLNKPGAIRNSRDVGVVIERTRADLAGGAAG